MCLRNELIRGCRRRIRVTIFLGCLLSAKKEREEKKGKKERGGGRRKGQIRWDGRTPSHKAAHPFFLTPLKGGKKNKNKKKTKKQNTHTPPNPQERGSLLLCFLKGIESEGVRSVKGGW